MVALGLVARSATCVRLWCLRHFPFVVGAATLTGAAVTAGVAGVGRAAVATAAASNATAARAGACGPLPGTGLTAQSCDAAYRTEWLTAHVRALRARQQQLQGVRMTFAQQTREFFDLRVDEAFFLRALPVAARQQLHELLEGLEPVAGPGTESRATDLYERFQRARDRFVVPKEAYEGLFRFALAECRAETRARLRRVGVELPDHEHCAVTFFDDPAVSWEASQGIERDAQSNIQVSLLAARGLGVARRVCSGGTDSRGRPAPGMLSRRGCACLKAPHHCISNPFPPVELAVLAVSLPLGRSVHRR